MFCFKFSFFLKFFVLVIILKLCVFPYFNIEAYANGFSNKKIFSREDFDAFQALKGKISLPKKTSYIIAYFEGGEYWEFTEIYKEMLLSIKSISNEIKLDIPPEHYYSPGWTSSKEEIDKIAESIMNNPDIDIVIAMGSLASVAILNHNNLSKPVLSIDVADPILVGLVNKYTLEPIAENFYVEYIHGKWLKSIALLDSLIDISKIGTMSPDTELGVSYCNINDLREVGRERGFDVLYYNQIDLSESVESCMKGINSLIAQGVEAMYIPALTCFDPENGNPEKLYKLLHDNNVATYAKDGKVPVMEGALIGISTLNYHDIGEAFTKLITQLILPQNTPKKEIILNFNPMIYINSVTANKLNIPLKTTLLTNVDSIYDSKLPKINK